MAYFTIPISEDPEDEMISYDDLVHNAVSIFNKHFGMIKSKTHTPDDHPILAASSDFILFLAENGPTWAIVLGIDVNSPIPYNYANNQKIQAFFKELMEVFPQSWLIGSDAWTFRPIKSGEHVPGYVTSCGWCRETVSV